METIQLIYASKPFGFDDLVLRAILTTARANNARNGITGALVCRHDLFLQVLEGPRDRVEALYARICEDDRHVDVTRLWTGAVGEDERMFPGWSMRDDPARSWLWSPQDVSRGALERASAEELHAVFTRIAAEAGSPGPEDASAGRCPVRH